MKQVKSKEVSAFIRKYPAPVRKILEKIRATVRKAAPDAEEYMGYGVPGYKMKRPIIYFAAFKSHAGIYPGTAAIKAFKKDLAKYELSKGTIRFPLDKPIPYGLIRAITRYRVNVESGKRP
jgi:uncharacterized protein YdhG (YjbR/CyaY superfamily)